jgi:hypothetical protein
MNFSSSLRWRLLKFTLLRHVENNEMFYIFVVVLCELYYMFVC